MYLGRDENVRPNGRRQRRRVENVSGRRRLVGKAQSGRCRPVEKLSGRRRPVEKRKGQ